MATACAVVDTPFGSLTVGAEEDAIVEVSWGASRQSASTPLLRDAADQLRAYFARRLTEFDVPLRLSGSPFQTSLWRRLGDIPYGETWTYGELAAALGSSPRAVGGACGRNPVAVIVPCHRVVGAQRALVGYSGGDGLATKAALLALEAGGSSDRSQLFHLEHRRKP